MPKVRSNYVSLYYDHYKDTFEQLKGSLSKRDRLTLFLLLLAVLVALLSFDTERTGLIFTQLLEKEYGIREIGAAFIDTASILSLTYITLAYYRICLGIERLYVYIHNVEYTLSAYLGLNIDRESRNYLSSYPCLLTLIDWIYVYLLPVLLCGFAAYKFFADWPGLTFDLRWLNELGLAVIALSSLIYIRDRYCIRQATRRSRH